MAAGLLIIYSGMREEKNKRRGDVNASQACWIGAVQGLCLPFRGFSRSGATISTGLLLGVGKRRMEEFSFALAVVLTPPVILRSLWRLFKERSGDRSIFPSGARRVARLVWHGLQFCRRMAGA